MNGFQNFLSELFEVEGRIIRGFPYGKWCRTADGLVIPGGSFKFGASCVLECVLTSGVALRIKTFGNGRGTMVYLSFLCPLVGAFSDVDLGIHPLKDLANPYEEREAP